MKEAIINLRTTHLENAKNALDYARRYLSDFCDNWTPSNEAEYVEMNNVAAHYLAKAVALTEVLSIIK